MKTDDSTRAKCLSNSGAPPATPPRFAEKTSEKYYLGHSREELHRLEQQAEFLAPSTRDFLERVGLERGMRVLDVGCGTGDVSFIAAELVDQVGVVIGFDRAETAVSVATARAQSRGLTNVSFVQCSIADCATLADLGPFDAVIGRLVMGHQANPVEAIRKVIGLVRPGGLVGFQESDLAAPFWSSPKLEILEKYQHRIHEILQREGVMVADITSALVQAFDEVGLNNRRIIRSGAIESACDAREGLYEKLGNGYAVIAAVAAKMGLPPLDFGSEPFEVALKREVESKRASFIPFQYVGAAGRLPVVRAIQD